MFSAEEESRIEQVNGKRDEITLAIRSLSSAVQSLDEHCKNKEQFIENGTLSRGLLDGSRVPLAQGEPGLQD